MADHDQVNGALKFKVLDNFEISPPQGSVPTTNIPLTFFDYLYLLCSGNRLIFLYEFPYTTHHFLETILPSLKQSLSLTLQHFFPYAATLVFPPEPNKPYIRYVADSESSTVTFTVAESTMDFNHIIADHPIDINDLDTFAPPKPPVSVLEDGTRLFPLMAIQVTVMPNSGFCIGINYHHVVADGMAFMFFMKAWASICKRLLMSTKTNEEEEEGEGEHYSLPIFNEGDMVPDPNGIELSYLKFWWKASPVILNMLEGDGPRSSNGMHENTKENHSFEAKGTIKLSQVQVDKLKQWISLKHNEYSSSEPQDKISSVPLRLSTFVAASALLWVCWVKLEDNIDIGDDEPHHFLFVVNCRGRYEFVSIPSTYFGNCVALSYVTLKKRQLLGENGIVEAAKAIGNKIKELNKNGVMKGPETWPLDFTEKLSSRRGLLAAGTPKMGLYETDFGVGRPKKCEFLDLQGGKSFAIFDSKDRNGGGVEVGFAFERTKLNNFIEIIQQSLKIL
ncbi:Malonyl-coenzyme:anthocyanin 5-O-glucoside-6'''-O-malonyltransferase [Quillaja saponaria]|uniref:Malonyl-coenzyme:anthocyanin 5-O-glucoside-6'''-O-malonyltransferase n=1 Tax=Quillaja saponaria TaxID=32244 RepID=A0AAD7PRA0_QUISA|nr:Malonyl-coenzyme:anthocyanin 5-O-glucoside-6'''-O-malonyltransferase [Quillaja saponaria]